MAISFNLIPSDLRVPGAYVEIDASKAIQGLTGYPTRVLAVGQRLDAGSVVAGDVVRVTRVEQAAEYFGAGSQLAHICEAFKAADELVDLWALPLDDAVAATAATWTVTLGGAATAAGTLSLYIGGRRVRVAVAVGDDGAAVATKLEAAIAAETSLAVTAARVDAVLTLTARNAGAAAGDLDLRHSYREDEALPAGTTCVVAQTAAGSGNPEIADVVAAIGDEWFTHIVCPWTDTANLAALAAELADRFGPLKMIEAIAFLGGVGTPSELMTMGAALNSPHLVVEGTGASPTPPWERAAALAAVAGRRLTIDPARPLQTLTLPGVLAPTVKDRATFSERDLLLRDGISTTRIGDDGTVVLERVITTYQETALGTPDTAWLDITTVATISYLRFDVRVFIASKFPRSKLADDGTRFSRGQDVVTPRVIRGELIARFGDWEEAGLVENVEQFKADLIVERDPNDPNRVNALLPPDIVNQLRIFAGLIQFRL